MTVKEIVALLPKDHPFRLEVANLWTALTYKGDCEYNRVMQEYGDYTVIGIEACDSGIYDNAVLWLKVERKEQ